MNYASIRTCDIANGEGVRVSLFVSGCTHRCKGCFNEEAQNFAYGKPFTEEVENEILDALAPNHIAGLTLLGGEPMEPDNQRGLIGFLRRFRERYAGKKTLWIYTGCVYEMDLLPTSGPALGPEVSSPHKRWRTEFTDEILAMTNVLVDGPFVESLKDISLRFRGSSNQRLLKLH
ncbi:MAG: radical SAM protein [Kiritimatiellae bacterium]|nr:radical SAM protein [Kiritimatiellia bacterium]